MRVVGRRGLLAAVAVVVALVVACTAAVAAGVWTDPGSDSGSDAATSPATGETSQSADAGADGYRFLSSPDFMNADVADLSGLPGFRRGTPNSWNRSYARAVRTVMDGFAAERPDDVLVAGDLVNGHWGDKPSRVFGPTDTARQKRQAISRAARAYYPAWRRLFAQRDLDVHVAVGDHEIGDNDWRGSARKDAKRRNVTHFKREFARYGLRPGRYSDRPEGPARSTAYATRLSPEVQLVTVDVFRRTGNDVLPELDSQQLRWLDGVLARAEADDVDWIIVQGHTPVLGPVRTTSSSGLMYRGGARSAFWRTLVRHDVDLYLSGEVHDITARREGGVTQISHGGIFTHANRRGRGGTNYLVGQVDGDELALTSRRFLVESSRTERRLWQATGKGRPPLSKRFDPVPALVGRMTLTSDGRVLQRSGVLDEYVPSRG